MYRSKVTKKASQKHCLILTQTNCKKILRQLDKFNIKTSLSFEVIGIKRIIAITMNNYISTHRIT